ncbi:hypothetical protein ACO2Q8_14440 [Larkinella sp. VNQ87]|uniref:hypothetical protein n=1 Tax=Larkinella sp. VNQ87 TaxID=3400921 RepID=UPI003C09F1D7
MVDSTNNSTKLPEGIEQDFFKFYEEKIHHIKKEIAEMDKNIEQMTQERKKKGLALEYYENLSLTHTLPTVQLNKFEVKVSSSNIVEILTDKSVYNPEWTHAEKIKFITNQPGASIFRVPQIVEEIKKIDLNWKDVSYKTIYEKIAPTVSRMVVRGDILKVRSLKNEIDFGFVNKTRFDENLQVKPEYTEALKDYEVIVSEKKLPPAPTGGNVESKTDGEKPLADAAEELNGQAFNHSGFSNSN